jgi:hypothetical protein
MGADLLAGGSKAVYLEAKRLLPLSPPGGPTTHNGIPGNACKEIAWCNIKDKIYVRGCLVGQKRNWGLKG